MLKCAHEHAAMPAATDVGEGERLVSIVCMKTYEARWITIAKQFGELILPALSILRRAAFAEFRDGFAQNHDSSLGSHRLKSGQRIPPVITAGIEEILGQAAVVHFAIKHQHGKVVLLRCVQCGE